MSKQPRITISMSYETAQTLWWWLSGDLNGSDETPEKELVAGFHYRLGEHIDRADNKIAQQDSAAE